MFQPNTRTRYSRPALYLLGYDAFLHLIVVRNRTKAEKSKQQLQTGPRQLTGVESRKGIFL